MDIRFLALLLVFVMPTIPAVQSTAESGTFLAASVKHSSGQPLPENNPALYAKQGTLRDFIQVAFHLQTYQVEGPAWMGEDRFDVEARLIPGATENEKRAMLKNLLLERFKLVVHHENRVMSVYELVRADRPLALTPHTAESTEDKGVEDLMHRKFDLDSNGYPVLPQGLVRLKTRVNGQWVTIMRGPDTMARLAARLVPDVGKPVVDRTALAGEYDFSFHWASEFDSSSQSGRLRNEVGPSVRESDSASGPTLFQAIEKQLGLKLKPGRDAVDVLFVDRAERDPLQN
jgi:uncharacterized protein (TIGR03435 family)